MKTQLFTAKLTSEKELQKARYWVLALNKLIQGRELVYEYDEEDDDPMLECDDWDDEDVPQLSTFYSFRCADPSNFRELPEKEYVPFTFEDAPNLLGKLIKQKGRENMYFIYKCTTGGANDVISYIDLFNDYTFLDGSPFGKIKE